MIGERRNKKCLISALIVRETEGSCGAMFLFKWPCIWQKNNHETLWKHWAGEGTNKAVLTSDMIGDIHFRKLLTKKGKYYEMWKQQFPALEESVN